MSLVSGLIPPNLADWRMTVQRLPGHEHGAPARTVAIARRTGVTLIFAEDHGWWTITKRHRGQTLANVTVHKRSMPKSALTTIERRRREQRAEEAQYLAGQR